MLYNTLKRMIERGQTSSMSDKLDILFAADRISQAQYTELVALLAAANNATADQLLHTVIK